MIVIQRFGEVGNRRVETFKQEIAKIPGVMSSASSTMVPGHINNNNGFMMEGRPSDQTFLLEVNFIDHDFPETYGLEITEAGSIVSTFRRTVSLLLSTRRPFRISPLKSLLNAGLSSPVIHGRR